MGTGKGQKPFDEFLSSSDRHRTTTFNKEIDKRRIMPRRYKPQARMTVKDEDPFEHTKSVEC